VPFSNLLHINSTICSHVQFCWNCILNPCFDTCWPSQFIATSFSSLIVGCDVFEILFGWSSLIYHERKRSHWLYMLLSKNLFWHIIWLHLGYHVFFILYNLLCVHVSLWISHHGVHLETYIHKSVHLLSWYPRSLPTIPLIHLVFSCVGKNLIYECLVYFNWILLNLYLLNAFGLKFVSSKCYRGSEDSMFVHIIFKYKYYTLCMNLGELPYFI
jgi:hypothetical protein